MNTPSPNVQRIGRPALTALSWVGVAILAPLMALAALVALAVAAILFFLAGGAVIIVTDWLGIAIPFTSNHDGGTAWLALLQLAGLSLLGLAAGWAGWLLVERVGDWLVRPRPR